MRCEFFVCVVTFSVCVVSFFCMRCEFFVCVAAFLFAFWTSFTCFPALSNVCLRCHI